MTHTELVTRAERWLRNTFHCRVVLSELVALTPNCETPDAIGWVHNRPILIECKTSVADFKADLKKICRRRNGLRGMGNWRFYLTPPYLLTNQELPEGWGLYEVHGKRVKYIKGCKYTNSGPSPFKSDRDSEVAMLVSALARKKDGSE